MDDWSPRQRDEADDALASWIKETCPELPDIIRKHIQTMTDLDGQGQDVLLRLILLSTKIHIPTRSRELLGANHDSEEMATIIRNLREISFASPKPQHKSAIDHTIAVLQKCKERQESRHNAKA
jgi:hypothetical protein